MELSEILSILEEKAAKGIGAREELIKKLEIAIGRIRMNRSDQEGRRLLQETAQRKEIA